MSKRDRELKQRLEELFSSQPEAEPQATAAPAPEETVAPAPVSAPADSVPVDATALPPSFELWKTVLDHLPLPVYVKDREHTWIAANLAFGELIGHPVATLLGHADKEQSDEAWQQDDQVLETAHADDTQQSTNLPDGSIRTQRIRRLPLDVTDGRAQYVLGIVEIGLKPPAVVDGHLPAPEGAADFRLTFERSPIGTALVSPDGRFLHVNRAWCDLLGYSESELRALRFHDLTHPADVEDSSANLRKMLSGAIESFRAEKRYLHRTGHEVPVELSAVLMRDAEHQPLYFIAQIQDSRPHKHTETRLPGTEALYQSVVDALPHRLCRKDLEGRFTFGNQSFCEIVGLSQAELIGKTDYDIHPAELAEQYRRDDQRVIEGGRSEEFVEAHRLKDSPTRYVRTIKTPVYDDLGRVTGIQIMFRDVTESQTVHEELKLRTSALESAANGIAITDRDGHILWINPAFTRLTGYSLEEATGQNPRVLKSGRMPPEFYRNMWQTISAGQVWHDELVNRRKDGTEYFEEMTITPVRTQGDEITHYIAVKQDISARKQNEDQLLRFKLGLERSNDAVFITDRQGVIQYINPAFEKIYQYSAAEALGQTPRILKSGVIPQEQYAAFWDALLSNNVVSGQIINRRKDGQLLVIEGSNNPIADEDGNILGFLAVHRDVTEREHAQEQLWLLTTAVENMATGVIITDQAGVIQWVNPAFTDMTGYLPFEAIGQTPRLLRSGKQPVEFYREMWNTITGGSTWRGELINRRKDGTEYNEELIITPLRAHSQEITHYIAVLQNITGRKATEAERERLMQLEARRVAQLQTAAEITSSAASMLNAADLPPVVVELIRERFDLYYAGLFLTDEARRWAVLQAGTGEAGRKMLEGNHRLEIGGASMIGRCIATGEARIALDVGQEAIRFNNPLLPRTRSELALPLTGHGHVIGALTIQSDHVSAFSPGDIATLQTMANQIAATIENARLLQEAQRRASEQSVLFKLAQALSAKLTIEQVQQEIYAGASQLIDTANFAIGLYDAARHEIDFVLQATASRLDQSIKRLSADRGLTGHVIRTRQSLLLNDKIDAWAAEHGLAREGERAQSWLGVPMLLGGQVLGAMVVQDFTRPNAYTEHDRDLLLVFGAQAAIAFQNARLFEEAQRRLQETQILQQFGQAVAQTLDVEPVLDTLVKAIEQQLQLPHMSVALIDREAGMLRTLRATGALGGLQGLARTLDSVQNDIMLDVARKGQVEVIDGWDERFDRAMYERENHARLVRAFVPMRLRSESIGVLEAGYTRDERPGLTPEELRVLRGLSDQVAVALDNARLLEQTRQILSTLQANETQLTDALRVAQLAYWEYDVEKDLFLFNDQFFAIFRTTAEQHGGYQLSSAYYAQHFVYPEDLPVVGAEIEKALTSTDRHYSRALEHRIQYADGSLGYISVSINIDRDAQGKILRYYGANQDITARKLAEEAIRRSEAQLSEALKIAKLANWEYDVPTDTFTFNDDFYALLRTTAEREGGYQMSSMQYAQRFVHPEDAPLVGQEIQKSIQSDDANLNSELDHRIVFADGEPGHITVRYRVQKDAAGRTNKIFGANQDITDRKQAEVERERALAEAERLSAENRQLYEQTQRDAERERAINRVTARIRNAQSVEQVLQIAAQELRTAARAAASVIEIAPVDNQAADQTPNGHGQNGKE